MNVKYNQILFKFIDREISEVYKKYNAIEADESNIVESFVEKIGNNGIDYDPYKNYYKTKGLAEALETEDNLDVIKLYIFLTMQKMTVTIEETREFYEELESRGYTKIGNHLFYHDYGEETLEAMTKEALENDLEDENVVRRLFDLDAVISMWIFQEIPRNVAREYIDDNGWMDYLDIEDLGVAYIDKYDCEVNVCLVDEGCDIFA